jgi:phytoene dehydrogenase-like protein
VPDDVPSDVHAVLTQLFAEGESAALSGEYETARQTVETAETVCRNKLSEGDLRARLLHGCGRVRAALDSADDIDADAAAAYLRAMDRRLESVDQ